MGGKHIGGQLKQGIAPGDPRCCTGDGMFLPVVNPLNYRVTGAKKDGIYTYFVSTYSIPTATRLADIISYAVWLYHRFNLSHRRGAGSF
jgi:hypothetical protein